MKRFNIDYIYDPKEREQIEGYLRKNGINVAVIHGVTYVWNPQESQVLRGYFHKDPETKANLLSVPASTIIPRVLDEMIQSSDEGRAFFSSFQSKAVSAVW